MPNRKEEWEKLGEGFEFRVVTQVEADNRTEWERLQDNWNAADIAIKEYLDRPDVCSYCGNDDVIGSELEDGTYLTQCGRIDCGHAWTVDEHGMKEDYPEAPRTEPKNVSDVQLAALHALLSMITIDFRTLASDAGLVGIPDKPSDLTYREAMTVLKYGNKIYLRKEGR